MYDYNWAAKYLADGRKKFIRPLYDRGLYIAKENRWAVDSNIEVGWKGGIPFITYHPDNTTTISATKTTAHWGGTWTPIRSQSVRLTIARYANLENVFIRKGQPYIMEYGSGITAPKIQGCRVCKQTGKVDNYCYPMTCWNVIPDDNNGLKCLDHPDMEVRPSHGRWHYLPCQHNLIDSHIVPQGQQCYYCNGTGKRDYGSKRISLAWDGLPLKLKEGKVIKTPITDLERMVADYVRGSISQL